MNQMKEQLISTLMSDMRERTVYISVKSKGVFIAKKGIIDDILLTSDILAIQCVGDSDYIELDCNEICNVEIDEDEDILLNVDFNDGIRVSIEV